MKTIITLCLALALLPLADVAWAQRGGQRGGGQRGGQATQQQRKGQQGQGRGGQQGQGRGGQQGQRGGMGQNDMNRGGRGRGQQGGGVVTPEIAAGLVNMREEEKLARDVYLTLGEKWDLPIFMKIAKAESRHMSAVGNLLKKYDLQDPIVDDARGVFTNERYADLYQQLVATGMQSAEDALRVGVQIEEMDINDLKGELAGIEEVNIRRVYQNLLRGSEQHLRAFTNQLR